MYWKLQYHKTGNASVDSQVSLIVRDMSGEIQARNSDEWISIFERRLKEIKPTNTFRPEYSFKATPRNEASLEVWKMKTNGDFNYKMFTLTRK